MAVFLFFVEERILRALCLIVAKLCILVQNELQNFVGASVRHLLSKTTDILLHGEVSCSLVCH